MKHEMSMTVYEIRLNAMPVATEHVVLQCPDQREICGIAQHQSDMR